MSTSWCPVQLLKTCVLLLEMSTLQETELHLDVSTLKRPVLLLDTTNGCDAPAHGRVYTTEAGAAP